LLSLFVVVCDQMPLRTQGELWLRERLKMRPTLETLSSKSTKSTKRTPNLYFETRSTAALARDHPLVAAGLAVSGVYDLAPIRDTSLGASRTTTRIGVGLKPLQGLFT
jgi:hypothetical protein